jgi:hypothetical protein
MSRKKKYLNKIIELCEMNGIQDASKDDAMMLAISAAEHYKHVSDFSVDYGYIIPEDYNGDPEDISSVMGLLATVFLVEERLQSLLDHWGFDAANYDFAPEVLESIIEVFKNRFQSINKQEQELQSGTDIEQ